MTPGARYRSQVCDTEIIVIRAVDADLACGGHPMIDQAAEPHPGLAIDDSSRTGSILGKRYTDTTGQLEVLVTKAGEGSLAANGAPLEQLTAKQLPSSD